MPRQFQVPHYMRTEQAHDIRAHRKGEPGEDLFADSGTANDRALFENQDAFAGFCKVGRTRESIVPTTNNNHIVARVIGLVVELHHRTHAFFLGGS